VPLHRATHHRAFELLAESQPTTVDQLDELTTFFEHTFVHLQAADDEDVQRLNGAATFPVETWNQHAAGSGGIARSTNSVGRRGVARRAAVTVPVSPSNRVEFHDWDSAGYSAPESTISTGYDWSDAPVGKKISFTERSIISRSLNSPDCMSPRLTVAFVNCSDVKRGQILEAEAEDKSPRPRPRPRTKLRGRGQGRGQFSNTKDHL